MKHKLTDGDVERGKVGEVIGGCLGEQLLNS